jgi:phosphoribosylformylglycinamidine synthase
MTARVTVRLKQDVMDPQGNAVHHALQALGYDLVKSVRVGKHFDIVLAPGTDPVHARTALANMADQLLANPVIEDYEIHIPSSEEATQ